MATRKNITYGPSKFDLMLALFDRKSVNTRSIEFRLEGESNYPLSFVVNGVEVESGSGESWIFKGYLRPEAQFPGSVPPPPSTAFGYYRTDKRTGWIEFVD